MVPGIQRKQLSFHYYSCLHAGKIFRISFLQNIAPVTSSLDHQNSCIRHWSMWLPLPSDFKKKADATNIIFSLSSAHPLSYFSVNLSWKVSLGRSFSKLRALPWYTHVNAFMYEITLKYFKRITNFFSFLATAKEFLFLHHTTYADLDRNNIKSIPSPLTEDRCHLFCWMWPEISVWIFYRSINRLIAP